SKRDWSSDVCSSDLLMPRVTLAIVVVASFAILCHLAVVLWLSWTTGSPGDPALAYTAQNFVEVFSDQRTYTVLLDTFSFALISRSEERRVGKECKSR